MTIETLQKLKDAGFPQKGEGKTILRIGVDGPLYVPTMKELIDSFGSVTIKLEPIYYQSRLPGADSMVDEWLASCMDSGNDYHAPGPQREDALANLYIHMHSEKVFPRKGDKIYRLNSRGMVIEAVWTDSEKQRAIKDFMGVYRTKEEAVELLERIKNM